MLRNLDRLGIYYQRGPELKKPENLKTLVCTWGQQNTMNQGLFDISSRYLVVTAISGRPFMAPELRYND